MASKIRKAFFTILVIFGVHQVFRICTLYLRVNLYKSSDAIVIGLVTCDKDGVNRSAFETITVIKSVFISAIMYNVTSPIRFHIFLKRNSAKTHFIRESFEQMRIDVKSQRKLNIRLKLHLAEDAVPAKYHKTMIDYDALPCSYVRMFFPDALPYLEEIVYLDTDTIVTGNISAIWSQVTGLKEQEMIGLAGNNEPGDINHKEIDGTCFGGLPRLGAKGMNSGVQFMNLAKMRAFRWTEKVIAGFNTDLANVNRNDQTLINIMLFNHTDRVKVVPCHYNFMNLHCDMGLTCWDADEDPDGIQVIHGAGKNFYFTGSQLRYIYLDFFKFQLGKQNIREDLMKPLRNYYFTQKDPCGNVLSKILFKFHF